MLAPEEGKEFTIAGFVGEEDALLKKVKSMGLREGKRIKVLKKNGRVYLLKLDNTRIALDEELMKRFKLVS